TPAGSIIINQNDAVDFQPQVTVLQIAHKELRLGQCRCLVGLQSSLLPACRGGRHNGQQVRGGQRGEGWGRRERTARQFQGRSTQGGSPLCRDKYAAQKTGVIRKELFDKKRIRRDRGIE